MAGRRRAAGFTLVEMLTVISIIMLIMALALPDFVHMMKERRWSAAIANIQAMVMRTRALATNVRKDFSVEFSVQGDNGTTMWIEAENNDLESIPDLWTLQRDVGGYTTIYGFMTTVFRDYGGTWQLPLTEYICAVCGYTWVVYGDYGDPRKPCPQCGHGSWNSLNYGYTYAYNFQVNPANAKVTAYADNTRQSETISLSPSVTIDRAKSTNFVSWDVTNPDFPYGRDDYPDVRIGPNGALVQSRDPLICLKIKGAEERRGVAVVRCTGRVIPGVLP